MAIEFARVSIVKAAVGSSAVGLSAYIDRDIKHNDVTGQTFKFAREDNDVVHQEVMLPEGAPQEFDRAEALWNAAERAELLKDGTRFREDAQVAKHMVLALPKELTTEENIELARSFAREHFLSKGLPVQIAIHEADLKGDEISENPHAHLLVATRTLDQSGFSRTKARHLNPTFFKGGVVEQDHWNDRWRAFQNDHFAELGIPLRVDDSATVPGVHVGPTWHKKDQSENVAANEERHGLAKQMAHDPEIVLDTLTERRSVFTSRDVDRLLVKHGIAGDEAKAAREAVLQHASVLTLHDRETGERTSYFTTRAVRQQELGIMERLDRLHAQKFSFRETALAEALSQRPTMMAEQMHAVRSVSEGGMAITGRAGTGKSFTLGAIRDAAEQSGYRVVGLAPTNDVAGQMRADGFTEASTAHSAVARLEKGSDRWSRNTFVVIDEAAMLDTKIMDRLTRQLYRSGARPLFAGDDRQFESVQRGGLFSDIVGRYGAAELSSVRRQEEDWARQASESFAAGRVAEGLQAYADRGFVHWNGTLDNARSALVAQFKADLLTSPNEVRFVYASTNAEVDSLNRSLREVHREVGLLGADHQFETDRGSIRLAAGDRIQFRGNDRAAGIANGATGTVLAIDGSRVSVRMDSREGVTFDGEQFRQFSHGYAGTIYRGQGKTQPQIYALYDHQFAWNQRATYVALTRHKKTAHLYVSRDLAADPAALARQMRRQGVRPTTLGFQANEAHAASVGQEPAHAELPQGKELTDGGRLIGSMMSAAYRLATGPKEDRGPVDDVVGDIKGMARGAMKVAQVASAIASGNPVAITKAMLDIGTEIARQTQETSQRAEQSVKRGGKRQSL